MPEVPRLLVVHRRIDRQLLVALVLVRHDFVTEGKCLANHLCEHDIIDVIVGLRSRIATVVEIVTWPNRWDGRHAETPWANNGRSKDSVSSRSLAAWSRSLMITIWWQGSAL